MATALDDPRWVKFTTQGLQCACGQRHVAPFPLQMIVPIGPREHTDEAVERNIALFL